MIRTILVLITITWLVFFILVSSSIALTGLLMVIFVSTALFLVKKLVLGNLKHRPITSRLKIKDKVAVGNRPDI